MTGEASLTIPSVKQKGTKDLRMDRSRWLVGQQTKEVWMKGQETGIWNDS